MHAGRVKTLHPGVHGGILAKRDEEQHMAAIDEHKISPIDVVIVNLYPFRQTVTAQQAPSYETAVENIDIGRPTSDISRPLLGFVIDIQSMFTSAMTLISKRT